MQRSSHGVKPKFGTAEMLWEACCEFFDWVEDNPLKEGRLTTYRGLSTVEELPKMRAMTIEGLCIFIDVSAVTWFEWKKTRADLANVIESVEKVIRTQKFTGAAADLLNANIIARDLGLADKREIGGPDGTPMEFVVTVPGVTDVLTNPDNSSPPD